MQAQQPENPFNSEKSSYFSLIIKKETNANTY